MYIFFDLIKDDELLKQYNKTWNKVSNSIEKGFDSQPVYNEKYLKAKIKFIEQKINTNFHDNRIHKEGSHCIYLSLILTLSLKWLKTIILMCL